MKNKSWRGLVGLAWIACAAAAPAQTAPAPAVPVIGDSIDVRLVNVEVAVTDRRGKRVASLKPGDFRLKVDGKLVPIEFFTEVSDGQAAPATAAKTSAPTVPGAEPGTPIGTHYLVFIDDLFSIGHQRDAVLTALKKDLGRLGAADSMSIVAWEGGRLARLAPWTSSRSELERALDAAMARPSHGLREMLELQRLLGDRKLGAQVSEGLSEGADDQLDRILGDAPGLALAEIAYARTLGVQISGAADAVISAMRGTPSVPGRKALLLLSGGWPLSLQSFVQADRPLSISHEVPESQVPLRSLANTANLLGYTLFPVDVPGLTSTLGNISENPLEGRGSFVTGAVAQSPSGGAYPTMLTSFSSTREQEVEATLDFLARETGGKALLNGNRMLALESASADTRSYYWLGFTPTWKKDGSSHDVRVEMVPRGLRSRSRRGYLDLTVGEEAAMKVESALLFGELPDSDPLTIQAGRAVAGKQRGVREIPLAIEIPVSAVTLLEENGRYEARAELRFAAIDDEGNQSSVPPVAIRLSSLHPPVAGAQVHYSTSIFLHGRASHLVAAIYDPLTGKVAAGRTDLTIP
jgi:VWFA-related protein